MMYKEWAIRSSIATVIISTGLAAILSISSAAQAANSDYRYDSLGRLRKSCSAVPTQGYRTDYVLDPADNRSSYSNVRTDIMMFADSSILSPDSRFKLRMQTDGNLVVYQNSPLVQLWSTNTAGSGANRANLQSDGNFVLYKADGGAVWNSGTYSHRCSKLEVQNDGNVVIKNLDDVVVWQTGTGGH